MFPSTEVLESTTHPGVKYTLKRVGIGLRRDIQLQLAKNNLRQRIILAEIESLTPKDAKGNLSDDTSALPLETQKRLIELYTERTQLLVDERLEWFKNIVVSIDSGDGEATSSADFIQYGPEDLFDEIRSKVDSLLGITDEQAKNSQRPSTSPQVEDGPTADTSAESAASGTTT